MKTDEDTRAAALLAAQDKAADLFDQVEARGMVRPGVREAALSTEIRDLAADLYGVSRHWHKRIVRSGPNTLHPYRENPPDRAIEADDIVFLDFGPIFAEWEADFGRTFVLGDDPVKHRLRGDLARVFAAGKEFFHAQPDITGEALFAQVLTLTRDAGWEYGGPHAGHLIGEFPHEMIAGDKIHSYIASGNDLAMRRFDPRGRRCHWILEIHLVDRERGFGGFYEELLTLG